jgi:BirA family biotin operon repressor/biotin-[acetyl-CoA-carboxylase] ligase
MMRAACDVLSPALMRPHLTAEVVGRHIYLFGTVDSTNTALRRLAAHGAADGTAVFAEEQTAGRGRSGVRWFSPAGVNLYVSVLFRPDLTPRDMARFGAIASLALCEAIDAEGAEAGIKWPNDVVVDGRKVGGALVEYTTVGGRVSSVILGIGVNLNVTRAELTTALGADAEAATSVSEVVGTEVDRNRFAARLLDRLEAWQGIFLAKGPAAVTAAWQARDALRGRALEIRTGTAAWQGRGRGIDSDGCLVVDDAQGCTRRVTSGAIRLLRREEDR